MQSKRVILISGTSSGFGKACAEHLCARGYRVFGTSRTDAPASQGAAAAGGPGALDRLQMNVNDDASAKQAVETVLARAGRIDVVVNNSGIGIAGAVEDTTIEEARAQFETNFFGVLRVCRAVLPAMRAQGSGTIINISSIGGLVGIPFQALYSASKFAVEGLSEALRLEVRPFGIRVVLVEPGDARTRFTARRVRTAASLSNPGYREACERAVAIMEADERNGMAPERVALLVEKIIRARSPRLRYVVAPAPEAIAFGLRRFVPAGVFEWGLRRYYRLG
jgi:NAD(P)-dependent dehydrogenase (short-subunit alcohol dehydrogenase family)